MLTMDTKGMQRLWSEELFAPVPHQPRHERLGARITAIHPRLLFAQCAFARTSILIVVEPEKDAPPQARFRSITDSGSRNRIGNRPDKCARRPGSESHPCCRPVRKDHYTTARIPQ